MISSEVVIFNTHVAVVNGRILIIDVLLLDADKIILLLQ